MFYCLYHIWKYYDKIFILYNFIIFWMYIYQSITKIKKTKKIIDDWIFVEIK